MRVRARYTKTGKLRFISAIDLGRVWERALRKADLPIAYSEGFSPHPKVSFPDALPLGYASTGEYVELTFAGPLALDPAVKALNAAFPAGVGVLAAVEVRDDAPRLARWLQASAWDLHYPADAGRADFAAAVEAATAATTLPIIRHRKDRVDNVDLRPALHRLSAGEPDSTVAPPPTAGDFTAVRAVVHHTEPPVRPADVHQALQAVLDRPLPEPVLVTRVAQGRPDPEGLREALSNGLVPSLTAATPSLRDRTSDAAHEHRHDEQRRGDPHPHQDTPA